MRATTSTRGACVHRSGRAVCWVLALLLVGVGAAPPAPPAQSRAEKRGRSAVATAGVTIEVAAGVAAGVVTEPRATSRFSAPPSDGGYTWPLQPVPVVLTPFRAPDHRYGPGHRGIDLAGTDGQPVLAARAGRVVFAGPVAGREVVSVQHDDGLRTTYEPVTPAVFPGALVAAGAEVGRLRPGHRGCPRACLHLGVRRGGSDYLDPLVLLLPGRLRLLPVPPDWVGSDPDGSQATAVGWSGRAPAWSGRAAPTPVTRRPARRVDRAADPPDARAAGTPATR